MKTVAIIPARFASTRLAAKPLIDVSGKPMIQHVYDRAMRAKLVDRVLVATDHENIATVVKRFGGEVRLTPPDLRSGTDRVALVAQSLVDADIIVNVQGDEPLIVPAMIDEAVRLLVEDAASPVGTLVKQITSSEELVNPNTVKVVIDRSGYALYFSRSPIPYLRDGTPAEQWHLRHTYYKHIGIYVFRKSFLLEFVSLPESALEASEKLEQLRILENGYRIKTAVTQHDSIPVDTMEDVEKVRNILRLKQSAVGVS